MEYLSNKLLKLRSAFSQCLCEEDNSINSAGHITQHIFPCCCSYSFTLPALILLRYNVDTKLPKNIESFEET